MTRRAFLAGGAALAVSVLAVVVAGAGTTAARKTTKPPVQQVPGQTTVDLAPDLPYEQEGIVLAKRLADGAKFRFLVDDSLPNVERTLPAGFVATRAALPSASRFSIGKLAQPGQPTPKH